MTQYFHCSMVKLGRLVEIIFDIVLSNSSIVLSNSSIVVSSSIITCSPPIIFSSEPIEEFVATLWPEVGLLKVFYSLFYTKSGWLPFFMKYIFFFDPKGDTQEDAYGVNEDSAYIWKPNSSGRVFSEVGLLVETWREFEWYRIFYFGTSLFKTYLSFDSSEIR